MQNTETDQFFIAPKIILIILAGLVLPVFLIPIIKFTGYSEIIEEAAKALIILFLILKLPNFKMKMCAGIGFGFLFGLSETLFYLNNIFMFGDFNILWQRFFLTVPMHMVTVAIMAFSGLTKKWFLVFGFAGAVILHVLFNEIMVELLI